MLDTPTLDSIRGEATIDVPTAGRVLNMGRSQAYAAARRGQIPTLQFGRSLRVPVPRLLALLGANNEALTPSESAHHALTH